MNSCTFRWRHVEGIRSKHSPCAYAEARTRVEAIAARLRTAGYGTRPPNRGRARQSHRVFSVFSGVEFARYQHRAAQCGDEHPGAQLHSRALRRGARVDARRPCRPCGRLRATDRGAARCDAKRRAPFRPRRGRRRRRPTRPRSSTHPGRPVRRRAASCRTSTSWKLDVYTPGSAAIADFLAGDRLATPLPVTHMNALAVSFMAMLMTGGCLIQLDRFHPTTWWQSLRTSRATVFHYLGVMPAMLLKAPPAPQDPADGSACASASAPGSIRGITRLSRRDSRCRSSRPGR